MNEQVNNKEPIKMCSKCKEPKPLSEFYKNRISKDGLQHICKICDKQKVKKYYSKNPEEILLRQKQHNSEHKDEINLKSRQYYSEHRKENSLRAKVYNLSHKEETRIRHKKYENNKLKTDAFFRIKKFLRSRVRAALKSQGVKKSLHTIELLGCTAKFYQNYLKSHFKIGMTMENNGKRKWHQHHPKQISSFDLSKVEEQKKAFHYTNVVPMWEDEHREWHKTHPE